MHEDERVKIRNEYKACRKIEAHWALKTIKAHNLSLRKRMPLDNAIIYCHSLCGYLGFKTPKVLQDFTMPSSFYYSNMGLVFNKPKVSLIEIVHELSHYFVQQLGFKPGHHNDFILIENLCFLIIDNTGGKIQNN